MPADPLDRLSALAATVMGQDTAFLAAIADERAAEAELLLAAIQTILPALPAIVPPKTGRLPLGDSLALGALGHFWIGDRQATAAEALQRAADLPEILEALARTLEAHARGKKSTRTAEARERALVLQAIVAIVKAVAR